MSQINNLNIPKIIGHRGVKNLAPENTLISILEAIKIGLKWVEVDVKISRDEIPLSVSKIKSSGIINGWLSKNSDLEFDPFLLANFCPPASFHISEQAEKIHLNAGWT